MEVALRRRLDGVADVSISQQDQTAEVTFGETDTAFSPEEFRTAVGEAGVVVVRFQIDACGSVERQGEERWLVAGKNRWRVKGNAVQEATVPLGQPLCMSGSLDDRARPPTLEIAAVRSMGE